MIDTSKIIHAPVGGGRYTVTAPIVKEDYGLYLKIEGLELPETYQVDFSNSEHNGTSVTMIGNADGVLIPHQFIDTGKDIFAFLYHVGVDYGRTVYKFRIPNKLRPDRTDEQPTPEEQSTIDQAISALNSAVAKTAQDVISADASAQSASDDADRAEQARDGAQTHATNAQASATSASNSASSASASATASANSASQSAQIKSDVQGLVSDAQGYANSASQSATASANSASQASSSAQSASQSATSAQGYASSAQTSAQTASAKASEASTSASTASTKATESAQSATNAQTYASQAESAKTASQTAQGLAEQAQTGAETAQGLAEDARDEAQTLVDGITGKVEQIDSNTERIESLEDAIFIEDVVIDATDEQVIESAIQPRFVHLHDFVVGKTYRLDVTVTSGVFQSNSTHALLAQTSKVTNESVLYLNTTILDLNNTADVQIEIGRTYSADFVAVENDKNILIRYKLTTGAFSATVKCYEINSKIDELDEKLTAEIDSLDDDRYKPYVVDSASGSIASFPDGADDIPLKSLVVNIDPVQDLHGYDSPWVAGGGKNKCFLNAETITKPSWYSGGWLGVSLNSHNGITQTRGYLQGSAGGFVVSGLSAGDWTISFDYDSSQEFVYCGVYYTDGTDKYELKSPASQMNFSGSRAYMTVSIPQNQAVIFRPTYRSMTEAYDLNNIQVESGSAMTSYAPYENICPISGWTECNVSASGKNLFDEVNATIYKRYFRNTAGRYVWSPSSDSSSYVFKCMPNTTYTLKPNDSNVTIFRVATINVSIEESENVTLNQVSMTSNPRTITTDSDATYIVIQMSNTITSAKATKLQIELGDSATEYESFKGVFIPISWQTEAGTVYGGKLDVLTGILTVYPEYDSYNGETLTGRWISDRDVYAVGTTPTIGAQVVNIGAQGTEIQLSPTEVKSLLGQNNIFADTGDSAVEYRADPTLYIQRLIEPDADMIADSNITSGKYFMVGNNLYLATANIASGSAVIVGTNAIRKSLSEALNEINS